MVMRMITTINIWEFYSHITYHLKFFLFIEYCFIYYSIHRLMCQRHRRRSIPVTETKKFDIYLWYGTNSPALWIFASTKWDGTKYFTLLQCRLAIFRNCALSSRHILAASTLAGLKIQAKIFIDDLHRAKL